MDNLITRKMGSKVPYGYNILNVTSRSDTQFGKEFSPFRNRGPIRLYNGFTCNTVENGWQYSKVYSQHTDNMGNPTQEYFDWATNGWGLTRAVRYPMGKGAKPLYSIWEGNKYGYVDARKKIYAPLYAKEIFKLKEFTQLKELYQSGVKICIYDFDAYNRENYGLTLEGVLNNPSMKMGHGFVLEMMLRGNIVLSGNTSGDTSVDDISFKFD